MSPIYPCEQARRHRWLWVKLYDNLGGVWDRQCQHCGNFYVDVIVRKPESIEGGKP